MDNQELRNELLKIAPPAGVSVTGFLGIPLSDWVYIATIIYIFVQCTCVIIKTMRSVKEDKKDAE